MPRGSVESHSCVLGERASAFLGRFDATQLLMLTVFQAFAVAAVEGDSEAC